MKNIFFITLLLIFNSCAKDKEEITFIIDNKSLFYFNCSTKVKGDYPIQYENVVELLKARNIIEYKLKNNSNKDFLFLMNPYQLKISSSLFKSEKISSENLFFIINDEDGKPVNIHSGNYNLKNWDFIELLKHKQSDLSIKKNIELDVIFRKNEALYNCFILKAGETKTFSSKLDLPIIEQPYIENYLDFLTIMLSKEEYFFHIYYNMSDEEIKKILNEEELEYLKEINLEVFSGELLTKKVKVIPIN